MPFRIETDETWQRALGTDGPAWANSYMKTQRHRDGDIMQRAELAAWFDAAIEAGRQDASNSGPYSLPAPNDGA